MALSQTLRNAISNAGNLYLDKRLLHLGVGNSSLPETFASGLGAYIGITISLPEIAHFQQKFANIKKISVILLNKYDPRMYSRLDGHFDLIIDVTLKSYACCEAHFQKMMTFLAQKLSIGGTLMTTETGVGWAWRGNMARSYTPGARSGPAMTSCRVLRREGLLEIGKTLGLVMTVARLPASAPVELQGDRILMLTKP